MEQEKKGEHCSWLFFAKTIALKMLNCYRKGLYFTFDIAINNSTTILLPGTYRT